MEIFDIKNKSDDLFFKFENIKTKKNYSNILENIQNIELEMVKEDFWTNVIEATIISKKLKDLKKEKVELDILNKYFEELKFLISEMPFEEEEMFKVLELIKENISRLEVNSLLNEEYDENDIYMEIHPGAGGVESHDFALMLKEMYERYFESKNYKYTLIDYHKGEVTGIKSVTLKIEGTNMFGLFKREMGVHRLIRISPFDSGKRRHTSFASVKISPVLEETFEELDEKKLRIDTYRSSGAGGQGVNTTDSAVRITHLPTNIVITCQNQRSQLQNKEEALKILKSKLTILKKEQQEEKSNALIGDVKSNAFGSQKRTYTLHPYKLVKDHISGYETTQVEKVLMGDLEKIIYANLTAKIQKNI